MWDNRTVAEARIMVWSVWAAIQLVISKLVALIAGERYGPRTVGFPCVRSTRWRVRQPDLCVEHACEFDEGQQVGESREKVGRRMHATNHRRPMAFSSPQTTEEREHMVSPKVDLENYPHARVADEDEELPAVRSLRNATSSSYQQLRYGLTHEHHFSDKTRRCLVRHCIGLSTSMSGTMRTCMEWRDACGEREWVSGWLAEAGGW